VVPGPDGFVDAPVVVIPREPRAVASREAAAARSSTYHSAMGLRVLCIDDDRRLFDLLADYMAPNGIALSHAGDGGEGLESLRRNVFDAVLLDVMMPGMDGVEVCRRIRERSSIPIIMLTARGDEADRVVGLEIGADDYVPKPFSPRELLARLRAVLRRTNPSGAGERVIVGGLEIDVGARSVRRGRATIDLTAIEFDLFLALARRPGRVVPRDLLLSEAGRTDVTVNDRTVDVHVSHLRRKLGDDSRAPGLIKTVRGVGYVFSPGATTGSGLGDGGGGSGGSAP
jgi:two-component system, OmpR family, response regulator